MVRTFVPYAGPKRATMTGGAGSGRTPTDAESSRVTRCSRLPEGDDGREARAETVMGPSESQLSVDVLVVDDDADVRWSVAAVLRSAGFSVVEAEDGEVAFGWLNTERCRMVLLDIKMPKRDGVSLIEAVNDMPPVVIYSAYSLDAAERERLGTRVVDYLHKPVSPQKLLRAVEAVLHSTEDN